MTEILKATEENIYKASLLIKNGEIVAFPTETVYGLGADAFNEEGVLKIFQAKKRPRFDPLIVHISNYEMIQRVAKYVPKEFEKLMEKFWPGPLTFILEKKEELPSITTGGLNTVAVRMPAHTVALKLIALSENPIAAPSANLFGRISPTSAEHVYKNLKGKVSIILNGGPTPIGIESTILKMEGQEFYVLRPGAIEIEKIEEIIGKKLKVKKDKKIESPGAFPFHYSPATPLYIIKSKKIPDEIKGKKIGYLAFSRQPKSHNFFKVKILSPKGDLKEAAKNFFSFLFELDSLNLDLILAEEVPEKGLGFAIMDRLKKASVSII